MTANKFRRHSKTLTLRWTRLSFPNLWEPKPVIINGQPKGAARFSCLVVLTDHDVQKIRQVEAELTRLSWPAGVPEGVHVRSCLRKGEMARPGDPNLIGKYVLSANSTPRYPEDNKDPNSEANRGIVEDARPKVHIKDPTSNRILETNDRSLVYSGCEAHLDVGLFTTQLRASEPQIDVGLNLVMLTGRKAPRFDNRRSAEQAFGDIDDDAAAPPMEGMEDAPDLDGEAPPANQAEADDDLSRYGL